MERAMLITRASPSGRIVTVEVPCTCEPLALWESGLTLIQDAMPQVPVPLREFVGRGMSTGECEEMPGPPPDADEVDTDDDQVCPECARSFGPHYRGPCEHGAAP